MNEYERPNDSSLSTADLVNRPAGTGAEGRTDEDEQIIQSRPAGMPTTERPVSTPLFAEQETREMRSR